MFEVNVHEKLIKLFDMVNGLYKIVQGDYFGLDYVSRDCMVARMINNQKVYMDFYITMNNLIEESKNVIEPCLHTLVVRSGKICQELFNVYKRVIEKSNMEGAQYLAIFMETGYGTSNSWRVEVCFVFSYPDSDIYYALALYANYRHEVGVLFDASNRITGRKLFAGKERVTQDMRWEQVIEQVKRDLSKSSKKIPDKDALKMYEVLLNNAGEFIDVLTRWFSHFTSVVVIYKLYP